MRVKRINKLHNICLGMTVLLLFASAMACGYALSANEGLFASDVQSVSAPLTETSAPAPAAVPDTTPAAPIDPAPDSGAGQAPARRYYALGIGHAQQDVVFDYCEQYDLPAELVFGIMSVESTFETDAVSGTGDYGIMQINSVNHAWLTEQLGVTDFLDFDQNVLCGVCMLSEYYHKYADVEKIAMCYRYGEYGAVAMWNDGTLSTDYTRALVRAIASLTFEQ